MLIYQNKIDIARFIDPKWDLIICGFFHFGRTDTIMDVIIPHDIIWMINLHVLQSLKVDESKVATLPSGIEYHFDILHLEKWSSLTCDGYNEKTGKGGILVIHANQLILREGSSINMTGKGYPNKPDIDSTLNQQLSGSTKLLSEKYKLSLGRNGGCIYLECDIFDCHNGKIVACDKSDDGGVGGTISIVINEKVICFDGWSQISAYTIRRNGFTDQDCIKW